MSLRPREYQRRAINAILARRAAGDRRTLAVMPTGSGKTVVAAHVADALKGHGRIMVLCHRDELVRQAVDKFTAVTGVAPAVEKADERSDEDAMFGKPQIVVSSVQTLNSGSDEKGWRMEKFDPKDFAFLWADEAHHSVAKSWGRAIEYFAAGNPDLFVLGVTATPDRADGEALGRVFQSCAFNYELPNIIRDGYLVPVRQRSVTIEGLDFSKVRVTAGDLNAADLEAAMMVEKPLHGIAHATVEIACGLEPGLLHSLRDRPDRDAALNHVLLGKRRRRTLVFCVTVAHAERTAEIINRWLPGAAAHVDGAMAMDRRRKTLADFAEGRIQFLCNCMVASEGFDEPGIELVVMARPTKSRALFCQQVGRGTRPLAVLAGMLGDLPDADARRAVIAASEKPSLVVLDFVGNSGRHKLVTAADVLGGEQYDAEVVERANQKAQEQAVDVETALAEAAAEIEDEQEQARREALEAQAAADAEEQRRQAEAARRAGLVGTAVYRVRDVDGFDPYAIEPPRRSEVSEGGATEGQIGFLVKLGVRQATAAMYSKRQAGAVIESIKAKRCTDNQAKFLMRWYTRAEIAGMNFAAASAAIEACKANGNRRPAREQAA
jgi:superfamily II DNA or RNA helicase